MSYMSLFCSSYVTISSYEDLIKLPHVSQPCNHTYWLFTFPIWFSVLVLGVLLWLLTLLAMVLAHCAILRLACWPHSWLHEHYFNLLDIIWLTKPNCWLWYHFLERGLGPNWSVSRSPRLTRGLQLDAINCQWMMFLRCSIFLYITFEYL